MIYRSQAERVSDIVFLAAVCLIGWLAYRIAEPFLSEIAWALVIWVCLEPVRLRLQPRLGPTRTALVLTLGVVVVIVVPVVFVGSALVAEAGPAVRHFEEQLESQGGASGSLHHAWAWARERAPFLPTEEQVIARITAGVGQAAGLVAGQAAGLVRAVASFLFSLGLFLAILFFLIRDASYFQQGIRRMLPFGRAQNEKLAAMTHDLVSASVTSTFAIAAIQGVVGGAAFALLGIRGAVLWGTLMAILALLPVVGATLIWLPAALWLALSGSLVKGIVLAGLGVLVLGNVDNVVRPLLLSGKSRLNTIVLVVSLMGGVAAFGFIGIVLGPLVATLVTALVASYGAIDEPEAPPATPEGARAAAPSTPVEPGP
jgi:predicted PurR-regulated permease PerM